ncbi:uncharacterized protein LOC143588194 [Bidens hawaiensis]|uniref:uncharacterized protein LOC143588194 n=1 Tax=Bidens hawaiensis TaxID=980011 RepID=UPI00404A31DB
MKNECPELRARNEKAAEGSRTTVNVKKLEVPKPQGGAFQITAEEAKVIPDVVTGSFLVNSLSAYVLFDSGASRSFISKTFACHNSFSRSKLVNSLEVEIASDRSFVVSELSQHHASIVCNQKIVQFLSPAGKQVCVYGERKNDIIICSMKKARNYLKHGHQAFLAYVIDTKAKGKELDQVPVINEFPDIFPDELPGVPHEREVEFKIDLVPGAKPVAKSPYRLEPNKMKELMSQFQDL